MTDPISIQYMITLLAVILWSTTWKLIALWYAGRNKQKSWFVCIAIFNTLGLLPIYYLFWGQKDRNKER